MMSFRGYRLRDTSFPLGTMWLLADIGEAKGKHELFSKQSPQAMKALRETALVESVESSNRIEGVTVEPDRLRPLVIGNAKPKDRPEEEIQGYRNGLNLIHTTADTILMEPQSLRELHATIQKGAGDAGEWKRKNNDIIEIRPGHPPRVRFRPLSAAETPNAIDELCLSYAHYLNQSVVPPLIALGAFVLDFLCIHPFRDGNGRVSRLLSLLGLYHHGFEVGRYISLEKLVEESREDYYEVLRLSSIHWRESKHDVLPWMNFFLTIIRRAYRKFEERAGQVKSPRGAKSGLIEAAIGATTGPFQIADIESKCPGVSRELIRKILHRHRATGKLTCNGRGPAARWRKKS